MKKGEESKDPGPGTVREPAYPEHLEEHPLATPDVDVVERSDEFLLRADMPGVGAEGAEVRVEDRTLRIGGRARRRAPADAAFLVHEYDVDDYHREFVVGDWVDATRITAEYSDGVFTLHLPKAETMKLRKIQVQKK